MTEHSTIRSDRELQDAVITYLTDGGLRQSPQTYLPLLPKQAQRAGKFARFLARRYYRDRLARSFRYSRTFAAPAESIVDTSAFDRFLDECVLGSYRAAVRVGEMAMRELTRVAAAGPWWSELLEYERLFFLQAATAENAAPAESLRAGPSACCRTFCWYLPDLLRRLKSGEPVDEELQQDVTLVFSRSHDGRIYVAQVDEITAAVFHAADGRRNLLQIAEATSLSSAEVQRTADALRQIGALVTSSRA